MIIQTAKISDFTDDAWDIIQSLDRVGGTTKSTLKTGNQIHKGFRINSIGKEILIKGTGRFDDIDKVRKIVYELKPNNINSIKRGIKQLNRYNNGLGGFYKKVLILY